MNLLSIILFVKNSNLRTRALYLAINLTVADMFIGGIATVVSIIIVFHFLLYGCDVGNEFRFRFFIIAKQEWQPFIVIVMISMWLPLTSVTGIAVISLDRMYARFCPFRHRNIKKMGLRGNNCGRLDLGIVLLIDPVLIIEGDKRSLQS